MADLIKTGVAYLKKWAGLTGSFANNTIEKFDEALFREFATDTESLVSRGPNYRASGQLSVIYLTNAEAELRGHPKYATLEGLDPSIYYNGLVCRVDLHPAGFGVEMQLVYDPRDEPAVGIVGFIDGNLQLYSEGQVAGKNPLRWVLKDSQEARTANIALYKAGTNYRGNDLVRWRFGSHATGFTTVIFSSEESGTDIPAPSRPEGDAYWSVFNPPPATYQAWETVSPAELRQQLASRKLSPNRLYIISPRMEPGEDDIQLPDVFIKALLENVLEPTGFALVSAEQRVLVNYDLATDTTTPIASGGASSFEQLKGDPYGNPALAAALAAKVSNETRNAPYLAYSNGTERGYQSLTEAVNSLPSFGGGVVEMRRSTTEIFATDRPAVLLGQGFSVGGIYTSNGAIVAAICDVYGRVINNGATLDLVGNITCTGNVDNTFALYGVAGSKTRMRGDITLTSNNVNAAAALASGSAGNATLEYEGTITVTNKGRAIVNQGARIVHRGRVFSADQGIGAGIGWYDLFATVDLRRSTTNAAPVLIRQNAAFFPDQHFTFHPGHELLAPGSQVSIQDGIGTNAYVEVVGSLVANNAAGSTVVISQLTPQAPGGPAYTAGAGIDISAQNIISATGAGIIYANPVLHSAGVNLTAADCGKHHVFQGTGVALWQVALPDPATCKYKLLSIQIGNAASGLWALQGTDIDGFAERRMVSKEVGVFWSTGTGWRYQYGRPIPLRAKIGTSGSGNIQVPADMPVQLALPGIRNASLPSMTATPDVLTVPRTGSWTVKINITAILVGPCTELDLIIAVNGSYTEPRARTKIISNPGFGSTPYFEQPELLKSIPLQAGDRVSIMLYSPTSFQVYNVASAPSYYAEAELIEETESQQP